MSDWRLRPLVGVAIVGISSLACYFLYKRRARARPLGTTGAGERELIQRYGRHLVLEEFGGLDAQRALIASKVLVVGCGGLASAILPILAGFGIGTIGLVDNDTIDLSNIHRQYIHSETDANNNVYKVDSAATFIKRINSKDIVINKYYQRLDYRNVMDIVKDYDLVVDATDNIVTKYILNDACVLSGDKPLIVGSAIGLTGQLATYNVQRVGDEDKTRSGCYRCIFPTPPKPENVGNCSDNGVIATTPHLGGLVAGTGSAENDPVSASTRLIGRTAREQNCSARY